ncbi:hypothetical protein RND81_09G122900 [Saponaria officinalis]|uniref:C3H1-type domain-containing protein n=1 Tax=Saponaria officinalis TaxID=3572 RepID=A0AAW1IKV8_SAPOF
MDAPHYNANSVHTRTSYTRDNLQKDPICRNFWSTGYCNYGDTCKFAHVLKNSAWQEHARTGNMNSGPKLTNDSNCQRTVCNYFARGRNCPYDRCIFAHQKWQQISSEEKRDVPRENSSISIQTVEARDTVDSRTAHHLKTRLCNNWKGGDTCPYGHNCTYAHGRAELRRRNLPSEHKNTSTTSKTTKKKDVVSNSGEQPVPAVQKSPPKSQVCAFRWNNRKIAGIYGDWIDEDSLDRNSSEKR